MIKAKAPERRRTQVSWRKVLEWVMVVAVSGITAALVNLWLKS